MTKLVLQQVYVCALAIFFLLSGCQNNSAVKNDHQAIDYIKKIPGNDEPILPERAQKGEVLIGYSDCYTCHKESERSVGPAFRDIAKRYPANKDYITVLAYKVIAGGSGSWGTPVMDPHPKLTPEDAKIMVSYILSLKN